MIRSSPRRLGRRGVLVSIAERYPIRTDLQLRQLHHGLIALMREVVNHTLFIRSLPLQHKPRMMPDIVILGPPPVPATQNRRHELPPLDSVLGFIDSQPAAVGGVDNQ